MCITVFFVDLHAPANVVATVESCNTVTLRWDQPSGTENITTSVSCTPPSPNCAECTTSPCNITGLNPSTEYEFTVTFNSSVCGTSSNKTEAFLIGEIPCAICCILQEKSTSFLIGKDETLSKHCLFSLFQCILRKFVCTLIWLILTCIVKYSQLISPTCEI